MKKYNETKEEFLKKNYVTCPKCGYNNERGRFQQYGKCLKCGAILDKKTFFMINMMKIIKDDKRKRS